MSVVLQRPIRWTFDFDLFFLFEIDVTGITLPMPKGVYPLEHRPGVSLVGVSLELGLAGALDGTVGAFTEINWCVIVEPDLSRRMPIPRYSVVTGKVGSDNEAFLKHAAEVDRLPIFRPKNLRYSVDRDACSAYAEDDDGPILRLFNTSPDPIFVPRVHWVQLRSREGGEWFQALSWTGEACEHGHNHLGGELFPHPFFEGVDTRGLGDRCYLQMVSKPRARIDVDFYKPVLLHGS
jgi:hypothetical protein